MIVIIAQLSIIIKPNNKTIPNRLKKMRRFIERNHRRRNFRQRNF